LLDLITDFVPEMAYWIWFSLLAAITMAWSLTWMINSNLTLPDNRYAMCTVLLDDSTLVSINGDTGGVYLSEALLFKIKDGQWSYITELTLCFVILTREKKKKKKRQTRKTTLVAKYVPISQKKNRNGFSYDFGCYNDHSSFLVNSSMIIMSQIYGSTSNYGDLFGITFDFDPNTDDYYNFAIKNSGSTLTTSLLKVNGGCGLVREDTSSGTLSYWILVGGFSYDGSGYSDNLQIYDGISWNSTTMPYSVDRQACMITNDNQYLFQFGGAGGSNQNSISYVDLDTLIWTNLGTILSPQRYYFSLAYVPPVSVYLIAGLNAGATLTDVELFNIQALTSQIDSNLNTASYLHSTRIFTNLVNNYEISKIYVIGGYLVGGRVEESNIIGNSTFTSTPSLQTLNPSDIPTVIPTVVTLIPTDIPTLIPTLIPSVISILIPSGIPTVIPSDIPTSTQTSETLISSFVPNTIPTVNPTEYDYNFVWKDNNFLLNSNLSLYISLEMHVSLIFKDWTENADLIVFTWSKVSYDFGVTGYSRAYAHYVEQRKIESSFDAR